MEAWHVTCLRDNLDQYLSCWASQLIPDGFCSGALDAEGLQGKSDVFIQSSDPHQKSPLMSLQLDSCAPAWITYKQLKKVKCGYKVT